MPDLSPSTTNNILDPDERSNSAPKKFRSDPYASNEGDGQRRRRNATAPFLSRRSSPPITSHLDHLHVALRGHATTTTTTSTRDPTTRDADEDRHRFEDGVDSSNSAPRRHRHSHNGCCDSSRSERRPAPPRVPPLHGSSDDAAAVAAGETFSDDEGESTPALSTSAPSASRAGSELLQRHYSKHSSSQQQNPRPLQQQPQTQPQPQIFFHQSQQRRSHLQQQQLLPSSVACCVSAVSTSSSSGEEIPAALCGHAAFNQASHPPSSSSQTRSTPFVGAEFCLPTSGAVDAGVDRVVADSSRGAVARPLQHFPSAAPPVGQLHGYGILGKHRCGHLAISTASAYAHPAGALFGHVPPISGHTRGAGLEPQTPPVTSGIASGHHVFALPGAYPVNMAVKVELPPGHTPATSQHQQAARLAGHSAVATEHLLGAGVSGINFHSSGASSSSAPRDPASSEGEPRSSSFSHSQGSTLKYGELIVLGYNGSLPEGDKGRRRSRFVLRQRVEPNGVKPTVRHDVQCAQSSKIYQDKSQHSVSYTLSRNVAVVVQYDHDEETDMFQIGRSSDHPIDFVVVDTVPGAKRAEECVVAQSTISRFACRILISRTPPYTAKIYAAGFDSSKNIFLGEKATKWENDNREADGEIDGLTTNGILIMHPQGGGFTDVSSAGCWREVSVGGGIYALRESRSAPQKSGLIAKETNELTDGTLIDLCGATLLWRSASSLLMSPTRRHLERQVEAMNQGRPQCPVGLNTLVIPSRGHGDRSPSGFGAIDSGSTSKHPYAYLNCGHVHGHHEWGKGEGTVDDRQCPLCRKVGPYVKLAMGSETGFYVDPDCPSFCFNPCGHMASEKTVKFWANVPIPHGCHGFRAICPFCATPLAGEAGYVKLIFQTDLD